MSIVTVHSALLLCDAAASPSSTVPDMAAMVCENSLVAVPRLFVVLYHPVNVVPLRTTHMYFGGN